MRPVWRSEGAIAHVQTQDVQPTWDANHRTAAVLDGRIYNAAQERELQSKGHLFSRDIGDAEIIVHGFQEWGSDLFRRIDGSFAIAIWERDKRRLVLARDRFGEKPLLMPSFRTVTRSLLS